jgi:hypothetical protein
MSGSATGGGPFLLGIDYGTESCRGRVFEAVEARHRGEPAASR